MVCTSCTTLLVTCTKEIFGGLPSLLPCPVTLNSGFGCEGTMRSNATVVSEADQVLFFHKFGEMLINSHIIDEGIEELPDK